MYVRIKLANLEDAIMIRDMAIKFNAKFAQIIEGSVRDCTTGWFFVNAWCSQNSIDEVLIWAARNEVKIFSIETGRGNIYYEAES